MDAQDAQDDRSGGVSVSSQDIAFSSTFVSIRVHWWFVFIDDPLFHPRRVRPVVGGGVQTYLKECAETDKMLRVSIK